MLNTIQKYILDVYLEYPLDDIEKIESGVAITAFESILIENEINRFYEPLFKKYDVLNTIQEIRKVLQHPCPQNRRTGSTYVGHESGYVVWEPNGHGNGIAKEPLGLLSLTARNDVTTEPVSKDDVVNYIQEKVKSKIEKVKFRRVFLAKCKEGDIDYIREKMANGIDPDFGSVCERPLLIATEMGHLELMQTLLDAGAKINYVSTGPYLIEKGSSALHIASRQGNKKAVELLLKYKADINIFTTGKYSPLAISIIHKHREIFESLLDNNAKLMIHGEIKSNLQLALESGLEDFILVLLKKIQEQKLDTPWIIAACFVLAIKDNNLGLAQDLFPQLKLDLNLLRWGAFYMIHLAAHHDNIMMLKFLCQNGAFIDIKDKKNNDNILLIAAENNALNVIQYLININDKIAFLKKRDLNNAMIYAIGSGHLAALKFLVNAGADIDHCTLSGGIGAPRMSMLTYAILKRADDIVDFLLYKDAKTHVEVTLSGSVERKILRAEKTPVHLFLSEGNLKSALFWAKKDPVQLLVKDDYSQYGRTPVQIWMLNHLENTKDIHYLSLMLAFSIIAKDLLSAKSLIKHGADIYDRVYNEQSPFELVSESDSDMSEILKM